MNLHDSNGKYYATLCTYSRNRNDCCQGTLADLKSKTWMNLVSSEIEFDFDRPYLNPHGFQILIIDMFALNIDE